MGVTLGETRVFGGIEACIHAGQDREATRRRKRQIGFSSECFGISLIGLEDLIEQLGHLCDL